MNKIEDFIEFCKKWEDKTSGYKEQLEHMRSDAAKRIIVCTEDDFATATVTVSDAIAMSQGIDMAVRFTEMNRLVLEELKNIISLRENNNN